jgi:beta-phosphoglucomutase-like phosphatase (HAD superfamily)
MIKFIEKYDLFIFDLDDTLVKTENYHYSSWLSVLKQELGVNFHIDFNHFISKFHSNKRDFIKEYLINDLSVSEPERLINKKNNVYFELINREKKNLKLIDGANKLLEQIVKFNKKFVIVSNSLKSNIDYFSEVFPILKKSSKNYYRELMINRKPNPECYLRVVADFPNNKMVGFEDSITGIHAMTQVTSIDTVFINEKCYYYYDFIINNYNLLCTITDYSGLQTMCSEKEPEISACL